MSIWWQKITDAVLGIDRVAGSASTFLNQRGLFSAGSSLTRRTFTITSPEILNIVAAPVVIVPAPAAGFMNVIVNILSSLTFNTTAYVDAGGSAVANLRYAGAGVQFGVDVGNIGDFDTLIKSVATSLCVARGSSQVPLAFAAFDGKAIELQNVNGGPNDYTLGDSDIFVDVYYLTLRTN